MLVQYLEGFTLEIRTPGLCSLTHRRPLARVAELKAEFLFSDLAACEGKKREQVEETESTEMGSNLPDWRGLQGAQS